MEAICPKRKICSFESVAEDRKTLKEACTHCGRTLYWNKDKHGRLDNRKYVRFHVRDFLQPTGKNARLFREIYGDPRHAPRKTKLDWEQAGEDAKKMVQELKKERQTL